MRERIIKRCELSWINARHMRETIIVEAKQVVTTTVDWVVHSRKYLNGEHLNTVGLECTKHNIMEEYARALALAELEQQQEVEAIWNLRDQKFVRKY